MQRERRTRYASKSHGSSKQASTTTTTPFPSLSDLQSQRVSIERSGSRPRTDRLRQYEGVAVHEALDKFAASIDNKLPPPRFLHHDVNTFRETLCYTEATDYALKARGKELKLIYEVLLTELARLATVCSRQS